MPMAGVMELTVLQAYNLEGTVAEIDLMGSKVVRAGGLDVSSIQDPQR